MEDDDLAEEIRQGEADAPAEPAAVSPARSPRRGEPEGWRVGGMVIPPWLGMTGVLLLLGGGVTFLLWGTSASDAFVYSKLVNEVMESPDEFRDRELRVEGQLQTGSVVFENEPTCEHRFTLEREGHTMDVSFPRCVVPDTFRDDMPMDVVVQGHLQADDTFLANEVIPRCPSKYEMQERQENGEEMPHGDPAASAGTPATAT